MFYLFMAKRNTAGNNGCTPMPANAQPASSKHGGTAYIQPLVPMPKYSENQLTLRPK